MKLSTQHSKMGAGGLGWRFQPVPRAQMGDQDILGGQEVGG